MFAIWALPLNPRATDADDKAAAARKSLRVQFMEVPSEES